MLTKEGFSQSGLPKKISDSTWEISTKQMKTVNKMYISLEECRVLADTLTVVVDSCRILSTLHDSTINYLTNIISIQQLAIEEKNTVITVAEKNNKEQNKKIRKLYNIATVYKLSTGVLIITTILFVIL